MRHLFPLTLALFSSFCLGEGLPNLAQCVLRLRTLGVNQQLSEFAVESVSTSGKGREADRLREQAKAVFNSALMQKMPGLRWYSFKEISGGLGKRVAPESLVGKMCVGLTDMGGIHSYQGEIVAATAGAPLYGRPSYNLTIRTREGDKEFLYCDENYLNTGIWYRLYLLGKDIPAEQAFRGALEAADFKKIVADSFGEPSTQQDYDVAIAATELFLALPASHGVSSVVKTLRGRSEANRNRPEFGLVAGNKRYMDKKLESFTRSLAVFLGNQRQMDEVTPNDTDPEAPGWVKLRYLANQGPLVVEYLKELRESSVAAPVETAAKPKSKPKTAGEFNKEAAKLIRIEGIKKSALRVRKEAGLVFERSRLMIPVPPRSRVVRLSTSKSAANGTTTLRYRIEGTKVAVDSGRDVKGMDLHLVFEPMVEIVFSTATAKAIEAPKYFWSLRKDYSSSEKVSTVYAAPDLDPEFSAAPPPLDFKIQVAPEVGEQRRRRVELEIQIYPAVLKHIEEKKKELLEKNPDRNLTEGGIHTYHSEEYNLRLIESESKGAETTDYYEVDDYYVQLSSWIKRPTASGHTFVDVTPGKQNRLRVNVKRNAQGEVLGPVEYAWFEVP